MTAKVTDIRPLTGRKVLMIALAFFGVMLAVNLFMAWKAIATFPGLEVSSSYADSQDFDLRRRAQEALGWQAEVTLHDDILTLHLTGPQGETVVPAQLEALLTRPTHRADDQVLELVLIDGLYQVPVVLEEGRWRLRLRGIAQDGTAYRHNLTFEKD